MFMGTMKQPLEKQAGGIGWRHILGLKAPDTAQTVGDMLRWVGGGARGGFLGGMAGAHPGGSLGVHTNTALGMRQVVALLNALLGGERTVKLLKPLSAVGGLRGYRSAIPSMRLRAAAGGSK